MILTAFDGKFHEKKDEIPPEACRPLKNMKKNNVEKEDPQKVEKKQCRTSGSKKVEKINVEKVGSYMLRGGQEVLKLDGTVCQCFGIVLTPSVQEGSNCVHMCFRPCLRRLRVPVLHRHVCDTNNGPRQR